jgi:hypothetical protein
MNRFKNFKSGGARGRKVKPSEIPDGIGKITIAFNKLEDILSNEIYKLLGIKEEKGVIITADLNFTKKLNLLKKLFNYTYKEKNEFKNLLKACEKCKELRNDVMHSIYIDFAVFDVDGPVETHTWKINVKKDKGKHEVTYDYLLDISGYIQDIAKNVNDFFSEIRK